MLSLTRKKGERIIINHGEIVIEVRHCDNQKARLSIHANRDISIDREEIYCKKREEMRKVV